MDVFLDIFFDKGVIVGRKLSCDNFLGSAFPHAVSPPAKLNKSDVFFGRLMVRFSLKANPPWRAI